MPRPKRSRGASTRPVVPPQVAISPELDRIPLADKAIMPNATARADSSSDIYDLSDREKERKRKRMSNPKAVAPPTGDNYSATLRSSRRRRDQAMARLDNLTSTTADEPSDVVSPQVETGRRGSSVPATDQAQAHGIPDASGLELDDSLFAALEDSIDPPQGYDQTQTRTGAYSTDTSSFNVGLFKRRPRASSVARDAPIRPSSRTGATTPLSSTFSFGLFKRRAREPSILGTSQKERSYRRAPSSQVSQASGDEAEDELVPDAAGTPLRDGLHTGLSELLSSREPSPVTRTRKRKSQEMQEGPNSPKRRGVGTEEDIHQSIEITSSPLSSVQGTTPERPQSLTLDDPAMAPPMSDTSGDMSPGAWPTLDTLAHRVYPPRRTRNQKTPELDGELSDMSSPPSLTHSPNYNAPVHKAKPKARVPSPKWSTKDLASLLPRRRARARSKDLFAAGSDNEADTASPGLDEDELSYVDTRASRRKPPRAQALAARANPRQRTYGRVVEDQEAEVEEGDEQPDESDDVETAENESGESLSPDELAKAARKFKEVDRWDLSFEEVTASSSPMPDVR